MHEALGIESQRKERDKEVTIMDISLIGDLSKGRKEKKHNIMSASFWTPKGSVDRRP